LKKSFSTATLYFTHWLDPEKDFHRAVISTTLHADFSTEVIAPMTPSEIGLLIWLGGSVFIGWLAKSSGHKTWIAWGGASLLFSPLLTLAPFLIVDARKRKERA
jgi:hypothetical protein